MAPQRTSVGLAADFEGVREVIVSPFVSPEVDGAATSSAINPISDACADALAAVNLKHRASGGRDVADLHVAVELPAVDDEAEWSLLVKVVPCLLNLERRLSRC
ncbi:TPA: hypothetical protein QDZ99_002984 [Stenotrophomonas maltophilia]|uniref:hypothetical protein n=1 Tax=Stenotrophomonas riyadhensis TaxID=2859893 RepID=UPI002983BF35|nr:hypothetical protein [Stenotrophomonas maltophilia]HDS1157227.1 hypothetical protein [Stenotrophomonas maltophilia]HDS1167658.1 hypothetical protein [Stenotrophomonas maltophilia]HDS1171258.1 hypothetical protein [Stenotrophomonas maltophilia]HDS1175042.1 hypothetical protein [Stenotrophomonas maltophilia]